MTDLNAANNYPAGTILGTQYGLMEVRPDGSLKPVVDMRSLGVSILPGEQRWSTRGMQRWCQWHQWVTLPDHHFQGCPECATTIHIEVNK